MTNESNASFIMGILIFSFTVMILFPMFINLFFPESQTSPQILNDNDLNILEDQSTTSVKIVKILKALFTFNAQDYGMTGPMGNLASLIFSICFYSAILALASIYWPLFVIAGIAAFIQSLSIFG